MIQNLKKLIINSTYGLLKIPLFGSYLNWIQEGSYDSQVERYPELSSKFETSLKHCYIAGDLTGIPLLKMASNGAADLVNQLLDDRIIRIKTKEPELIIIGAGIAGVSAALEAASKNINFILIEANQPYSTIANFPVQKPIFLKPNELQVHSRLRLAGESKEILLHNLIQQLNELDLSIEFTNITHLSRRDGLICAHSSDRVFQATAVILAIGKSGNYRRLNIPGESLHKVSNRLIDPNDFKYKELLVVGGGDSAIEASIACVEADAKVTLSYRGREFAKVKPENLDKIKKLENANKIRLLFNSDIKEIFPNKIEFKNGKSIENESVLTLIGKELPYQFFKKSDIRLNNEWSRLRLISLVSIIFFFTTFYLWKKGQILTALYCFNPTWKPQWLSIDAPFIYGALYSTAVSLFGFLRVRRKATQYIKLQTMVLTLIQIIPLWILPTLLIPWMGHVDLLPDWFKTQVLMVDANVYLTGSNCWRLYGLILAWPLFPFIWLDYNVTWFWIIYGTFQTFLIIPWLIYFYGKGAYCGWICSCGALAETVGDQLRTKTPHGPFWKKAENWGQVILLWIVLLTLMNFLSILSGIESLRMHTAYLWLKSSYVWLVDFALASVLGVGMYIFLGGRFWCRLFCPLAALMHIYTKFSKFRIFSDKEKCISCNICTKVCHQGIDVMNFANKGIPMNDVQCVGCSACITECPTEVLSFGSLPSISKVKTNNNRIKPH